MTTFVALLIIFSVIQARRQMFVSERIYTPWLLGYWIVKSCIIGLIILFTYQVMTSGVDADYSVSDASVLFVVDVSTSMDVADMSVDGESVTRKRFTREVLTDFVAEHPGYQYAVVVFADEARTLVPSTTDPNILANFLGSLESFDSLPGGSNFQSGLMYAGEFLDRIQTPSYLVLISDGGDEFVDLDMTQISTDYIIDTLVLGVGSDTGGYVPDGVDPFGRVVAKQYQGQPVTSKINQSALKDIASDLGGSYSRFTKSSDLDDIVTTFGVTTGGDDEIGPRPFVWWIVAGVILYLLCTYFPWRRVFLMRTTGRS